MLDTLITENEVFTLTTSFRNLIKKLEKACPDCKTANLARENAVIRKDNDVIAISVTIDDLEKRLTAADSLAKSNTE